MTSPRISIGSGALVAAALLACTMMGCGGGGSTTTSVVTTFTPDTPPASGPYVYMQSGASSGSSIVIKIAVKNISAFFGAGFRINYDPTALLCNSNYDASTSFLLTGVTSSDVEFLLDCTTTPGVAVVTATRKDPTVAPPVDATDPASELIKLSFSSKEPIPPGSATGLLTFDDPKQVCNGDPAAYPLCGTVPSVSWIGGSIVSQ